MTAQFRNLIFEGGGVKGIAYVVRRVGGTSAGAINALILALGFDLAEQKAILESTDFSRFMDDSFEVIRDIRRLATKFGWYKGDFFSGWIGNLIESRMGSARATFGDLKAAGRPDLYVIGANLSTGYAETFSAERHADMPLAEALRISMSIPLFFAAVRRGERQDVYVDGGVQLNYPVKLFDRLRYIDTDDEGQAARPTGYYTRENARFELQRPGRSPYVYNRQTRGLRLDTREEIGLFRYDEPQRGKPIKRFTDYAKALMEALLQAQENQHLHSDDYQRTVYIDSLNVKTTDFHISRDRRDRPWWNRGSRARRSILSGLTIPKKTR